MAKIQTVDQFVADMDRLEGTFGDSRGQALEECAPLVLGGIEENFAGSHSSEGETWPPRKDPKPTHPLLILTGNLRDTATHEQAALSNQDTLEVGVRGADIVYAARQQWGDTPPGILPRPFIGISDDVEAACAEVIADHALQEFA